MKKTLTIATLALLTSAAPSFAHHGTSAHFNHGIDITVEGVISEMKFVNPHSYLYFDVPSDTGETVPWRCEMVEAGTIRRAGVTEEMLAPGTIVQVYGKPARREDAVCYLETLTFTDGRTISHRGQIGQSEAGFEPSEAVKAINVSETVDTGVILATGGSEAANREIVPVPTEGMFGHWADGARSALNSNRQARGQGQRQGRTDAPQNAAMGAGMAAGMARSAGRQTGTASRNPIPQYNDTGQALADRYDANYDNPALACSASILFGMGHHSLPNEFVQLSEKELRLTYGYMDMVRTIHMDDAFPAQIVRSTSGYSIGRWDDDKLSVTTKGFLPGVFWAFAGAGPNGVSTINSDQLEFTEEYTYDESTDTLHVSWTATDPGYWTTPLQGEKSLTRAIPYEMYGCEELAGENNLRPDGPGLLDAEILAAKSRAASDGNIAAPSEKPALRGYSIAAIIVLVLGILGTVFYRRATLKKEDAG